MPKEASRSYISNADIKGGAERYEKLMDEKAEIGEAMKDLAKELKSNGVNMKALKEAVKRKRTPVDVDHESTVLGYLRSMGVKSEAA